MEFSNPLLRGLYPDPSICKVGDTYYLVCSTFEYWPAVPIFASKNLVDWEQIGNVLDRPGQISLLDAEASQGIFAPTIRFHNGLFYMVTTVTGPSSGEAPISLTNFFVTATDPAGPWSDPVVVDVDGIDPSLFWEDGNAYMQYAGRGKIMQVRIDDVTGEVLEGPRLLTTGCGGRDVEGPHMWVRDGWYYLLMAEGGTREGHHVTMMRGKDVWGPFELSPHGPVAINRDLRVPVQRVGHADWVVGPDGDDYLVLLGVREVSHRSLLGRETMLCHASWTQDGWLIADGQHVAASWDCALKGAAEDDWSFELDMEQHEMPSRIVSPRTPNRSFYQMGAGVLYMTGNGHGLRSGDSCCWGVRQPEFDVRMRTVVDMSLLGSEEDEIGRAILSTNKSHLSIFLTLREDKTVVAVRRSVLDIEDVKVFTLDGLEKDVELAIDGSRSAYRFSVNGIELMETPTAHVTVENAGTQNTGVIDCLFVSGEARAQLSAFEVAVKEGSK